MIEASPALPPNAALRWDRVARLLPRDAKDVLEIGCGQGGFAVRLARRYRYVGVDIDAASVDACRARLAAHGVDGEVRVGDLSTLSADERFDIVCAFEVLEHVEDDRLALGEWAERVRPGGTLLVSVPAWAVRYSSWDELGGHFRRYDPDGLAQLLKKAGLAQPVTVVYGWPLGYLLEAVRNSIARRRGIDSSGATFEERTSASARVFHRMPDGGRAILPYVATRPFAVLQRLKPDRGTGLVGIARKL
ncbi:MAG: class I SAM-dependent methyltransferase [Gaiellaceae bacterium]